MSRTALDLKVALRAVIRSRFVSMLAIVAFALGVAVTTAVFSIFNGVLLAPLPFPEPDRLVMVYDTQPACATCPASYPKYNDWRERNHPTISTASRSTSSASCRRRSRIDIFVPLQRKLDPATRGNHFLTTYARLKPGVTVECATAEMRALGHTLARSIRIFRSPRCARSSR